MASSRASVHDEEEWLAQASPFTTRRSGVLKGVRSRRYAGGAFIDFLIDFLKVQPELYQSVDWSIGRVHLGEMG